MLNDEKRGVEEAYQVAGNTSDLRVEGDTKGDADLIIAAGWSPSRVGMALLRLHSEWDKAEKPQRPSPRHIDLLADTLQQYAETTVKGKVVKVAVFSPAQLRERARKQAQDWYMHEMAKLVNKLKSLPAVRSQLTTYVPKWGIAEASMKVPAVIAYWLDQTCRGCHGLKFQRIDGAPTLGTKVCRSCGGTGVAPVPHGQEGRRVANYMDDCVQKARTSIRNRLLPSHPVA